jgi:hypothetical protein
MSWGSTTSELEGFLVWRDPFSCISLPCFDVVMECKFWLTCLECLVAERIQGVLADILEPIMGKGLIPADLETWRVRRRGLTLNESAFGVVSVDNLFLSC